jgi:hypothetical protein
MFGHVAFKVRQQFHFLFQSRWVGVQRMIGFVALLIDKVDIAGDKK